MKYEDSLLYKLKSSRLYKFEGCALIKYQTETENKFVALVYITHLKSDVSKLVGGGGF